MLSIVSSGHRIPRKPRPMCSGDFIVKECEHQLPLTEEDGEYLDVIVAHVNLGWDATNREVTCDLVGYWATNEDGHNTWFANDGMTFMVREKPVGMQYLERRLKATHYSPDKLDTIYREDSAFAQVRADVWDAAEREHRELAPVYI